MSVGRGSRGHDVSKGGQTICPSPLMPDFDKPVGMDPENR